MFFQYITLSVPGGEMAGTATPVYSVTCPNTPGPMSVVHQPEEGRALGSTFAELCGTFQLLQGHSWTLRETQPAFPGTSAPPTHTSLSALRCFQSMTRTLLSSQDRTGHAAVYFRAFSTSLMLRPFNSVHAVANTNHKIISFLLRDCNFATVM